MRQTAMESIETSGRAPTAIRRDGPHILRFATTRRKYIYDANTNRLLQLDPVLWEIMGEPWDSVGDLEARHPELSPVEVRDAIAKYEWLRCKLNVFSNNRPSAMEGRFSSGKHDDDYRGGMSYMILEATQACNLRCRYCTFSDHYPLTRGLTTKSMLPDTAKKAIDFFAGRSRDVVEPKISFYGGEPFLNFPLIRDSIEYARRRIPDKSLYFRVTTNGTLIRNDILPFLVENDVHLAFTLDGPAHCHDRNRVTASGEPTFQGIMETLAAIRKQHPDYYQKNVRIQSVIAPNHNLRDTYEFFANYRESIGALEDAPRGTLVSSHCTDYWSVNRPSDEWAETLNGLRWKYYESLVAKGSTPDPFLHSLFGEAFQQIYTRDLNQRLPDAIWPNGCCIPCVQRLFVDTDGQFHLCERINDSFPLGNVERGIDFNRVRELEDAYIEVSMPDCADCWAIRLCSICFVWAAGKDGLSPEMKKMACAGVRDLLMRTLVDYCEIAEIKPDAFAGIHHGS